MKIYNMSGRLDCDPDENQADKDMRTELHCVFAALRSRYGRGGVVNVVVKIHGACLDMGPFGVLY